MFKKLTLMQRSLFESKLLKTYPLPVLLISFVRQNPTSMRSIPMFIVPHWLERSTNTISLPIRPSSFALSSSFNPKTKMCDALRDLILFVQFKKREKTPMEQCYFSKVAGFSLQLYEKKHSSMSVCFTFFKLC